MMHVQAQPHGQGGFQGPMQQQQNTGQSRGQQPGGQQAMKQPGSHDSPISQNSQGLDSSAGQHMSLWTITKPINAESWEHVDPQQLHVPLQDLQEDVARFRRQKLSVKDILMSIRGESPRKLANELVVEQNEKLWKTNPLIHWTIASINLDRDIIKEWPNKGRKKLKSIELILKTESRPMAERPKPAGMQGGNAKQGGGQAPRNNQQPGQNTGQHQQGSGQQFHDQPMRVPQQGGYPPPPPPVHGGQLQGVGLPPPPPPPPPPIHGSMNQPQIVSEGFPEPILVPQGMHGGHPMGAVDPYILKKQKHKSKIRLPYQIVSDSDSDSDSSGSDSRYSSRSVEHGFGLVERSRSRGRRPGGSRSRSRSRSQHRNRSHGRGRVHKVYKDRRSYGRERSDVEGPPMGKYDDSPNSSSPRTSSKTMPPQNIFNIRMVNDNDGERDPRRSSHSISPTGFPTAAYKKHDKYGAQPMSRNSSLGSSDTGSSFIDGASSIYSTADDSVFSEPIHSRGHSRTHSEAGPAPLRSRGLPQPSYPDYDRRIKSRYQPNDYPHPRPRDSFDDHINRPPPSSWNRPGTGSRRLSMQFPNPFDTTRYPPQRSMSYIEPEHPSYKYPQQAGPRYITGGEHDPYDMHDFADAMEHIRQTRRQSGGGMLLGRGSLSSRMGMGEVDAWDSRPRYDRHYSSAGGYRY